jgi:hypothetical protein
MGKVLFTTALLCLGMIFTSVVTRHSSFSATGVMWMSANSVRSAAMECSRGRIELRLGHTLYLNETSALIDRVSGPTGFHLTLTDQLPLDSWFGAGSLVFADTSMKGSGSFVVFPTPLVFCFLAAPVIIRAIQKLRYRRLQHSGYVPCPACGYDLRASSGRCPECGRLTEVGE